MIRKSFTYIPQHISTPLHRITSPLFSKYGTVLGSLMQDWSLIVGSEMSSFFYPVKIVYSKKSKFSNESDEFRDAILHVHVSCSSAALKAHYMKPIVIEKINTYLGAKTIHDLVIKQGYVSQQPAVIHQKNSFSKLCPEQHQKNRTEIKALLQDFPESSLKQSLINFGSSLKNSSSKNN